MLNGKFTVEGGGGGGGGQIFELPLLCLSYN